ncbi:MAG TPA: protoglobin domain-containing protein [Gemmataceae bacterium]|jgi:hypothetical protein|nr:protoglobin domain-containing protein [Gemmataceae bacterium]
MNPEALFQRYQELQRYVGWSEDDARRIQAVAGLLDPHLGPLIDDFYDEIARHPDARKVITGGQQQIQRLKGTLTRWLRDLLTGPYDSDYVLRRWRVGWRHVEIGLDQVYTNVALSRLRTGLTQVLQENWQRDLPTLWATVRSLNRLLDLDLAEIEDAYQTEHTARQFRTLVEAAPCMIVILRPDGSIAYFSPFAEKLTGYAAVEVLGKDYLSQFVPEGPARPAIRQEIERVFAGVPAREFENPVRCKDASRRWMVWNAERLREYEGRPAVLAVGQDITTLKQAQEQALQAERLATLGQMVAGLAHESRNALQLIQASVEMLVPEVEDRPEALALVADIQAAEDRLHRLFEDIRGYAAPINLERNLYHLAKVWREAWGQLASLRSGRQVELREESGGTDLECPVDLFSLERVFRNIFENSLAACGDPVRIDIRCLDARQNGRAFLEVAVRDNGPGLAPEQREKIFQPFYTTKRHGTGLGMAIAKRIVEAHGGRIAVGDGASPGAEILIWLPRSTA